MSVSTRMSVDSSAFKQGVDQARASLKTLDAALKNNEASFRAGGNAEIYMTQKSQLLNDKMTKQRELVNTLQQRMAKMKESGVSPLSTEYQKLETQLLNAQTSMLETKTTIDELDVSQKKAADSATELSTDVSNIGKKMSLDQVISGINRITSVMEAAARKAAEFGQAIWSQITETAAQADDLLTMAVTYGVDPVILQKQLKIFNTMADTSIETYYKARDKINKAVHDPSKDQLDFLETLGLVTPTYDTVNLLTKDADTALWAVGQRIQEKVKSGEYTTGDADYVAMALFGINYKQLKPLFDLGKDAFDELSGNQSAATEEALQKAAELNDSIELMKANFETLKLEVLGGIAPEIQTVTDAISELINKLIAYAQSEEGQALLKSMADSIAAMLSDLANIDPQEVISKFTDIFDTIKSGFNWITEHKDDIKNALLVIAGGFAALKVSESVLTFIKLWQGAKDLLGIGSRAAAGAGAGAGAGTGGGTAAAAGSGLTLGGIGSWFSGKFGGLAKYIPSTAGLWNVAPVGDWFMNNTYIGQNIRNTGDIGGSIAATFDKIKTDLSNNFRDFGKSWSGVFDEVGKLIMKNPNTQASKYMLFDPEQLQREIEALMPQVEVETDPTVPSGAASDISRQVGTVPINARLNISNYPSWISWSGGAGGGGGGRLNSVLMTHATGMPYVPYDGYLAMLHRGERVLTAGDNRDYSPVLNRRVNMDNGHGNRMINVTLMIGPERLSEILVPLIDNGLGEILSVSRR